MTFEPEYIENTMMNPDTVLDFYDKCNINFLGMYEDLVSLDSLISEIAEQMSGE